MINISQSKPQKNFIKSLLSHPLLQSDVEDFIDELLDGALQNPDIRSHLIERFQERHLIGLIKDTPTPTVDHSNNPSPNKSEGRITITARQAAKILGYHPKYFSRKARDWGLSKIYMSCRSCRYYLDEIDNLTKSRTVASKS